MFRTSMISPFHLHIWECPPLVKWKRVDHENKKKRTQQILSLLSVSGMKQKHWSGQKRNREKPKKAAKCFCLKTLVKENSTRFRSKKNNVIVEENLRLLSYVWNNKNKKRKLTWKCLLTSFYQLYPALKAFCTHFTNFFKWS